MKQRIKNLPALLMIALIFVSLTAIMASKAAKKSIATAAMHGSAPILVIDAGHGGLDGGAVSVDGLRESTINLAIAQKLFDLNRFLGRECVMTRAEETLDYPPEAASIRAKKVWDQHRRVAQINAYDRAILISIHQNTYPDARPSGTQVLYASTDGSKEFAEMTHKNLCQNLCPDNRRVAVPASDTIYLMKNVRCPAILIECGFLSNPAESEKLASSEYQTYIAAILCASYQQFTDCL